MDIVNLCRGFCLPGEFFKCEVVNSGNINTTYKVIMKNQNDFSQYLLQKINKNVFHHPERIMENIKNVNEYVDSHHKCEDLIVLHFLNSYKGEPF